MTGGEHENPLDTEGVSDDERADLLAEYLDSFREEFGTTPKLMPIDSEGKGPIIQGRCRLNSDEGRSLLVDGDEAVRQIRETGARGFALYAGKKDHGTEHVVFVDHDSDEFPVPTGTPTLEVMSGSGGDHETYRNDPDDPVANARVGDNLGEIRAENWYVVLPGSIHPSGGVYHVVEDREIATLSDSDLTDEMRPATAKRTRTRESPTITDTDGDGDRPDDTELKTRLERAFENSHDGHRIKNVYDGKYKTAGFGDRSSAEFWLANRLDSFVAFGDKQVLTQVLNNGNLQKWDERTDQSYRESILSNVGCQDWYADTHGDTEHVALLPNTPIAATQRGAVATWDWRQARDTLTTEDVQERTREAIATAYERGDRVLIDAIMSAGKSYGAIEAAAQTGEPITFLTGRGREEQYQQIQDWCDKHGVSSVILPTIGDCETYAGAYEGEHEHAEHQKQAVRRWYQRGATGKDIHIHAENEFGRPLVCDGPAGARCTYKVKWESLNPEDYDVLIGHYNHAHVQSVVQNRTLVIDEFPEDTYINEFGPGLASAVTTFLQQHEHVEVLPDDYADLIDVRSEPERRSDALAWFLEHGVNRDGTLAFQQGGQANAPLAAFTLLASANNDLGNGFEQVTLPGQYGDHSGDGVGVYDREKGHVQLLTPPDLRYAKGLVALDGTPVPDMWDIVLGAQLNHRPVLTDDERAEYITESQQIDIVRTTEYVKPGGQSQNVYLEEDRALFNEITDRHGQHPDLITTKTVESVYESDEEGILQSVNERAHHGNIKGSNKFAESRLGAVLYSRHFGDRYVQLWGALAGERVERGDGRGVDLEYSGIGKEIHKHMTHHETMQAVMRFGRDGNGATVYVHTNTLPEWVPLAGEGRVTSVWADGMQQVLEAANELDHWRTADIAANPAVDIGERQVRSHLHTLVERGVVAVTTEGRGFVWQNDELHRVNEHGDVELPPVDSDDLGQTEVAELVRLETYTWEFRKNHIESGGRVTGADSDTVKGSMSGNDPSPDTSYAD